MPEKYLPKIGDRVHYWSRQKGGNPRMMQGHVISLSPPNLNGESLYAQVRLLNPGSWVEVTLISAARLKPGEWVPSY